MLQSICIHAYRIKMYKLQHRRCTNCNTDAEHRLTRGICSCVWYIRSGVMLLGGCSCVLHLPVRCIPSVSHRSIRVCAHWDVSISFICLVSISTIYLLSLTHLSICVSVRVHVGVCIYTCAGGPPPPPGYRGPPPGYGGPPGLCSVFALPLPQSM